MEKDEHLKKSFRQSFDQTVISDDFTDSVMDGVEQVELKRSRPLINKWILIGFTTLTVGSLAAIYLFDDWAYEVEISPDFIAFVGPSFSVIPAVFCALIIDLIIRKRKRERIG